MNSQTTAEGKTLRQDTTTLDATSISIKDVDYVYPSSGGDVTALSSVTLEAKPNEIITIVGPSGCGKSTLLMLVAGLNKPTRGEVRIGSKSVDGPDERLGVMFQTDLLLDWRTILQNVLLQSDIRKHDRATSVKRAKELLEIANLTGFEDKYPRELSGGMRQRAAICRTLLHDPGILLMDEPFAALDALTRDQMTTFLESLWEEQPRTILFVTHSIPEAVFLADRVVVMSSRPGTIDKIIDIDLPRPRVEAVRGTQEFTGYVSEIRACFA